MTFEQAGLGNRHRDDQNLILIVSEIDGQWLFVGEEHQQRLSFYRSFSADKA
jgi:hypothetical protein